jgi:hypothetical protein
VTEKLKPAAKQVLARNRAAARRFVNVVGPKHAERVLTRAQGVLTSRIEAAQAAMGDAAPESFTVVQAAGTRAAIQDAVAQVQLDLASSWNLYARGAAWFAARNATQWMNAMEVGTLALDEAALFDMAYRGAESTLLRMRASQGDGGVLQRYGFGAIGEFEQVLQTAVLTNMNYDEAVDLLTERSPFLEGKPRYWAERIVRTEMLGALNAGQAAVQNEMQEEFGDLVKVLVATFDDRTSWDSYYVHGQVRRLDEPFECRNHLGLPVFYMNPPGRPNDRETIVSWRLSWGPLPAELRALPGGMCIQRWMQKGSKKRPPPSRPPIMSPGLEGLYEAPAEDDAA